MKKSDQELTVIISRVNWNDLLNGRTKTIRIYSEGELHYEFGDYAKDHIIEVKISKA